jgi:hypothetical protein
MDSQDLMNMGVDDELSVLDIFDPIRRPNRPQTLRTESNQSRATTLSPISPDNDIKLSPAASVSPSSFPYPIKLRLKLTAPSEMKVFSQLVQQIRNEYQSNQVRK